MINVIEQMKQKVEEALKLSLNKAMEANELPRIEIPPIFIDIPKEKQFGDFSTNIAMQLARQAKMPPVKIASIIINNLRLENSYIEKVECAGPGFINFYLKLDWLYYTLQVIQKERENYGKSEIGKGQKVMVEFKCQSDRSSSYGKCQGRSSWRLYSQCPGSIRV